MKNKYPIILIEDDDLIRQGLYDYLYLEEYKVLTAANGRQGLDLIREHKGRCLILLDLQMPVMTGEQVLKALESEDDAAIRSAPVIILTARVEGLEHPAVRFFIKKPIDLDKLIEQIDLIITDGY